MSTVKRVVIVPGNGCVPVARCNWYAWMANQIRAQGLAESVELRDMPDPYVARESAWLPFIVNEMGAGEDTVVVGHSSGAVAAMRLCETHRLAGVLLVSACHTDLGDDNERASGYYSRPWRWDAIRANAGALLQLHSADDPLIPVAEARHVAAALRLSSSNSSSAQVGGSSDGGGSSSSSGSSGAQVSSSGSGSGGNGGGGGDSSSQSLGEYRELKRRSHFFEPSEDLMAALRDVIESANAK